MTASAPARVVRTRGVGVGLAILAVVVLLALLGPLIAPHGETDYVGPPNSVRLDGAPFGTDHLGQDVWSRFLLGGRSILLYAATATAIGVAVGAAIGLTASASRGVLDDVLMRAVDVLLAIPQFLLVLVAITTVGPEPWLIVAATAFTAAPRVARVVRGAAVAVVESDYVQVSESIGESTWHIIRTDLLANTSGPLLVEASIRFTYSIGIVATLAFLGFNAEANAADWGVMVQENRAALAVQPWGVLLPVVAIAALSFAGGRVADGIARTNARPRERA